MANTADIQRSCQILSQYRRCHCWSWPVTGEVALYVRFSDSGSDPRKFGRCIVWVSAMLGITGKGHTSTDTKGCRQGMPSTGLHFMLVLGRRLDVIGGYCRNGILSLGGRC